MSSTSVSSSSSAAANTVVVTARDIEFSNYDKDTGKWGNAILTMMIEDTSTPDHLNLEVYDEKVYAVFKNHDDPTDLIQTSAEVDGMDFRVTIDQPMLASGKYELYKVYGETSGEEYATSSQFYIQVPGKVWDFKNDVVDGDVELVSEWWNYGSVTTSDGVVHYAPTQDDILAAGSGWAVDTNVLVNGETLVVGDIVGYKMSSRVGEAAIPTNKQAYWMRNYENLEDFDIVSSKLTNYFSSRGPSGWKAFNKKFAFPNTMTEISGFFIDTYDFNKPVYVPDSVTTIYSFFGSGLQSKANFKAKIRLSRNISKRQLYNMYALVAWAGSFADLSRNVQLEDGPAHPYLLGDSADWGVGLKDGVYETPSSWTYVPNYFLNAVNLPKNYSIYANFSPFKLILSEGLTSIHANSVMNNVFSEVVFPSTMTNDLPANLLSGSGANRLYTKVDMGKCSLIDTLPSNFLAGSNIDLGNLILPPNLKNISNHFLTGESVSGGYISITNWPVDEDGKLDYHIQDGVETIGSHCFGTLFANRVAKITVPSSVKSVGTYFAHVPYTNGWGRIREADLTEVSSPEVFAESDYSFACYPSSNYQARWKIYVAPGTSEAWAERFPNISREYNGSTYWARYIEWVEKPAKYGYVFYETNYTDDEHTSGYVELQSMDDFNKLVNGPSAVSDKVVTLATNEDGDTIDLHFGIASRATQGTNINTITGVAIGTEITAMPDHFLRSYRYLKKFKWGGNETSVGQYFGYNAGQSLKAGDRDVYYDLKNIPDTIESIPSGFFENARWLNEEVHIPNSVTSIIGFLSYCASFNQPIEIPNSVTSINGFLSYCTSFNQPIEIPNSVTSLNSFLSYCTSFNQPIEIPNSVTSINGFLSSCTSFNQPIEIPNSVTSLISFLSGCTSFNQPIEIPNSVTSLNSFLFGCTSFNQPIEIPNSVTSLIGFLSYCTSFNQPISVNNGVDISGFLEDCTSFNSPVTINNVSSHSGKNAYGFLKGCTSFNQPIDFSPFSGANQFSLLSGCTSFNSPIVMFVSARAASSDFLFGCTAFNQSITLPNRSNTYEQMYSSQCYNWKSFNQPVTIPASWGATRWYNSATLFESCDSLTEPVTIEATTVPNGQDAAVLAKSFSTTDPEAPAYKVGVTFRGPGAAAWKAVLPDSDVSPYRKIIVEE